MDRTSFFFAREDVWRTNWSQVDIQVQHRPHAFDPFLSLKFPYRGVCISWLLRCLNHTEVPCLSWEQTPFECAIWLPSNASTFLFADFSNQNVALQPLFNLVPGRVVPAKLLCWVNFPVFPGECLASDGSIDPFPKERIYRNHPIWYLAPWLTCPNSWPAFSHQQGIVFEVHLTLVPMNS